MNSPVAKQKEMRADGSGSLLTRVQEKASSHVSAARGFSHHCFRVVADRVRSDSLTLKAAAQKGSIQALLMLKRIVIFYLVALIALMVFVCVLFVCLWMAGASAFLVRYYTLSRVPGNHVIPLNFNAMPLYTEWWRNKPIDDTMADFLPSIEGASTRAQRGGGSGLPWGSGPMLSGSPPDDASLEHDDLLSRIRRAGLHVVGGDRDGSQRGGQLIQTQGGKLLDYKLTFLQQYANSILATSTMPISTGRSKSVFMPGGTVNMEAIFDYGSPMFSAPGSYSGRVQLVFLRENVGRDVSIVVEGAMLFAEDEKGPQALHSLDVLFHQSHSVSFRTGELPAPLLLRLLSWWLRLWFYVPIKIHAMAQHWIQDARSAPFAPIDYEKEVAVSVDLYQRFTPPTLLRRRLRAMNFTVFYNHIQEGSAMAPTAHFRRPTLARMTFYSHVQLRGATYYVARYPVITYLAMAAIAFVWYSTVAVSVLVIGAILLYTQLSKGSASRSSSSSRRARGDQGERDTGHYKWGFDPSASFSSSGVSPTTPGATPFSAQSPHGRHRRDWERSSSAREFRGSANHDSVGAPSSARLMRSASSSLRLVPPSVEFPPSSPATQVKKQN